MKSRAARLSRTALAFRVGIDTSVMRVQAGTMNRYESVATELRALGLTIRSLPGEYCVNFRGGGEKTARSAEDLDQALKIGREIASEAAASCTKAKRPPRRRRWRKRMTPKARRRRFIRAHNRRVRARALRKQR